MTFAALVLGDAVFVDANVFVYHFAPDPVLQVPWGQLLRRIENQGIQAFTSTHVLAEAAHRLLTLEARTRFGWSSGKVVQQPGLLITDALSVALMQAHGLTKLASDDADADRVPGLTHYAAL